MAACQRSWVCRWRSWCRLDWFDLVLGLVSFLEMVERLVALALVLVVCHNLGLVVLELFLASAFELLRRLVGLVSVWEDCRILDSLALALALASSLELVGRLAPLA